MKASSPLPWNGERYIASGSLTFDVVIVIASRCRRHVVSYRLLPFFLLRLCHETDYWDGKWGVLRAHNELPAVWFVARKRGLAIGIVNIGVCLGLSLSGLLLPNLINYFESEGWRHAWYLTA